MISGSVPLFGKLVATASLGAISVLSPAAHHATTDPLAPHHLQTHAYHGKQRAAVRSHPKRAAVRYVAKPKPLNTSRTIIGDPSEVGRWTAEAMRLTGVHGKNWSSGLAIIEYGESNDNQLVAPSQPGYDCDSNCLAGTPSEGIVQTIQATMNQYHQRGTSHNMLNPVADISASINYINAKYGGISNVPGVISVRSGGHYVGY